MFLMIRKFPCSKLNKFLVISLIRIALSLFLYLSIIFCNPKINFLIYYFLHLKFSQNFSLNFFFVRQQKRKNVLSRQRFTNYCRVCITNCEKNNFYFVNATFARGCKLSMRKGFRSLFCYCKFLVHKFPYIFHFLFNPKDYKHLPNLTWIFFSHHEIENKSQSFLLLHWKFISLCRSKLL